MYSSIRDSGIKALAADGDAYGTEAITAATDLVLNKAAVFTVQKIVEESLVGSLKLDGETKTVDEMLVERNIARASSSKKRSGSQ